MHVSARRSVPVLRPLRTGFAARWSEYLPRREKAFFLLGLCPNRGAAPSVNDGLDRKGLAASSHRGGEAVAEIEFAISTSPSPINCRNRSGAPLLLTQSMLSLFIDHDS